jgi:hypothetical protein
MAMAITDKGISSVPDNDPGTHDIATHAAKEEEAVEIREGEGANKAVKG